MEWGTKTVIDYKEGILMFIGGSPAFGAIAIGKAGKPHLLIYQVFVVYAGIKKKSPWSKPLTIFDLLLRKIQTAFYPKAVQYIFKHKEQAYE